MTTVMFASYVALWVIVLLLLVVVAAMVRQIGLISRRVAPVGARMSIEGPAIGAEAPMFDTLALDGNRVTLGTERRKQTLLVFVTPGCSTCSGLMPAVHSIARSERRHLEVVLLSLTADEALNREYVRQHELADLPYVTSQDVVEQYQVSGPPYAVLVGEDGLVKAKGLVNHFEHLDSLLTAAHVGHATMESYHGLKAPDAQDGVAAAI